MQQQGRIPQINVGVIWNEYRSKESHSSKVLQWALLETGSEIWVGLGSLELMNFLYFN